jgi:hypothetical protein
MTDDVNRRGKGRVGQLRVAIFDGRNVLVDYYLARVLKLPFFSKVLEDVFEGGLRAWMGH